MEIAEPKTYCASFWFGFDGVYPIVAAKWIVISPRQPAPLSPALIRSAEEIIVHSIVPDAPVVILVSPTPELVSFMRTHRKRTIALCEISQVQRFQEIADIALPISCPRHLIIRAAEWLFAGGESVKALAKKGWDSQLIFSLTGVAPLFLPEGLWNK